MNRQATACRRPSTGPPSRPNWTSCGCGRRRTPGKATRSPRPGGGSDGRGRPRLALIGPARGGHAARRVRGPPAAHRLLLHVAPRPSRGRAVRRAAPGAPPRSRSCPTCIRATSPTRSSARARTTRAPATATSWAGTCRGTRRTASARHAARRAPGRHDAPRLLPARRRPRLRDLLDDPPRRRGDGLQLRAHGPHRVRTPGGVGGLARRLAHVAGRRLQHAEQRAPHRPVVATRSRPLDDLGTA